MPRVNTSAKQKNKKFKGTSRSAKKTAKVAKSSKTKGISKVSAKRVKSNKNQLVK